jgi:gamma-tubulin complex component 3
MAMTTNSTDAVSLPVRDETECLPVSIVQEETMLIRECFYSLQGISGDRIRFDSVTSNGGKATVHSPVLAEAGYSAIIPPHLRPQSRLGSGAKEALLICAEAGWLFSRIKEYVDTVIQPSSQQRTQTQQQQQQQQQQQPLGSIQRALASALQLELQSYHCFLSELEPQIPNLSIRQLLAQMQPPLVRLEHLASLTDGAAHAALPGPQILHSLRLALQHGNSRKRTLVQSLLTRACTPWFDMLYLWTIEGILSDPAHEFFVVDTKGNEDDRHLWKEQYRLDFDKVPFGILDEDLIQPAFVVGKAINYIRKCLQDGGWSLQLLVDGDQKADDSHSVAMVDQNAKKALGFVYTPNDAVSAKTTVTPIRQTLTRAATLVHSHILKSLHEKHSLFQHLFALKQFLLLGQGDFFATLMIGIHNEFEGFSGLSGIYRHTLAAIVDSALRNTNATGFPSDILARLHVELNLKPNDDARFQFAAPKGVESSKDTRTVWDIFELEYQVPDPLLVIVHPEAMGLYKTMFHLLFDIRRLEFMLNLTWRQSATLQHSLQKMVQRNGVTVNKRYDDYVTQRCLYDGEYF